MNPGVIMILIGATIVSLVPAASAECVNDPLGGRTCVGSYSYGSGECNGEYTYTGAQVYHFDPATGTYLFVDYFDSCTSEDSYYDATSAYGCVLGLCGGGGTTDTQDDTGFGATVAAFGVIYGGNFVGVGYFEHHHGEDGECFVFVHTSEGTVMEECPLKLP